ncbi:molybdenum ABC transporter ATP-binding protein [Pelagivirga sediminicola]|uniref:Molybdenum ABC transporter ATP-binding protein n=1 Tax=Pelagivirga sediminicola TaxID=2170575 RepID=A0A2T7G7Y5_9RHOB|nr:molybdenum ABC transporter ATP-binding protein [Pelagivirga sediminicola]PVA10516.1 molybdenum ABC transporter ATP-binding protein [Pelagivirga sediminicola]
MSLSVDIAHRFDGFALEAAFEAGSGVTAIFGPSGSGKSTIGNAVAGLLRPDRGRIELGGDVLFDRAQGICIAAARRRIGVVFQEGRLFPHLDVARNIAFGARYAPAGAPGLDEGAIMAMLGIEPLMARRPRSLSGGEKQRVAIARALLMRPRLLLMDEPLAALDGPRKDEILPYLERLRDSGTVPIVYITHSVAEIARLADRIVVLREGRVLRQGDITDVLSDPAMVPLIGVREAGSVLIAKVTERSPGGLSRLEIGGGTLRLPGIEAEVGQTLRVRVLAQDVLVSLARPEGLSSRNILPAVVEEIRRGDGPGVALSLRIGEARLLARITADALEDLALRPGMDCYAVLKATAVARADIGS